MRVVRMQRPCALLSVLALDLCINGGAESTLRERLLKEARTRILEWHADSSLLEKPLVKNDIALNMLKHDMPCGGDDVPVGYAEFEVVGARPVDVFNTVMNIAQQSQWNPKCDSMHHVGDFIDKGARGWDNVFNLIFDKKLEFLVWQVADFDIEREEFWMVTTTSNNSMLRDLSPKHKNWVEADNCLGGYYIRKSARGSHVVITQHANAAVGLWFPFHLVLEVFPVAWKGMIDFITHMSEQSRAQAAKGWSIDKTVAPSWMVPPPTVVPAFNWGFKAKATAASPTKNGGNPKGQTASEQPWLRIAGIAACVVCALCCCTGLVGVFWLSKRPAWSSRVSESASQCSHMSDLSDFDSESNEYL